MIEQILIKLIDSINHFLVSKDYIINKMIDYDLNKLYKNKYIIVFYFLLKYNLLKIKGKDTFILNKKLLLDNPDIINTISQNLDNNILNYKGNIEHDIKIECNLTDDINSTFEENALYNNLVKIKSYKGDDILNYINSIINDKSLSEFIIKNLIVNRRFNINKYFKLYCNKNFSLKVAQKILRKDFNSSNNNISKYIDNFNSFFNKYSKELIYLK